MNDEIQHLDTDVPVIEDTPVESTYTPYELINFENGTLVTPGSYNPETGELTMPVYSGKAPVNATNLNHLEQGLKNLETYVLTNGGPGSNSEPIGTIKAYAGTTIPDGYLICDGSQVSKIDYGELFAVLGTAFNLSSDTDSTKFRIPDLRGRVIVGVGSFDTTHSFTLAKTGGEYEHVLTESELPKSIVRLTNSEINGYASVSPTAFGLTATSSGGKSHNNVPPYIALNFIIKVVKSTTLIAEVEDSLESDSTTNAPSIHAVTNIIESQLDMANTRVGGLTVNKLRVQNKLAILDFEAYATNFQHGYNLVGKIPSKFLPKASGYYGDALLYFPIFLSGMNLAAYGRVTSDGSVEIYSDTNSSDLRVGYVPTTGQIRIHTNWFVE